MKFYCVVSALFGLLFEAISAKNSMRSTLGESTSSRHTGNANLNFFDDSGKVIYSLPPSVKKKEASQ
jgi:hypothetical protein